MPGSAGNEISKDKQGSAGNKKIIVKKGNEPLAVGNGFAEPEPPEVELIWLEPEPNLWVCSDSDCLPIIQQKMSGHDELSLALSFLFSNLKMTTLCYLYKIRPIQFLVNEYRTNTC